VLSKDLNNNLDIQDELEANSTRYEIELDEHATVIAEIDQKLIEISQKMH
jgi:hypothetical protein